MQIQEIGIRVNWFGSAANTFLQGQIRSTHSKPFKQCKNAKDVPILYCIFLILFHDFWFFSPLDIKLATLLKVKLWLGCCLGALLVRVCCRLKDVSPYKVSGWGRGLKYRTKYTCSLFNTNPAPSPKEILSSFQQKSATHLILSTQLSLAGNQLKDFGHRWLSTLPAVTLGAVKMSSR